MNSADQRTGLFATSAPRDFGAGTGDGSIIATAIARGATVERFTSDGTIRPFGQNIDSADDATAISARSSSACAILNRSTQKNSER